MSSPLYNDMQFQFETGTNINGSSESMDTHTLSSISKVLVLYTGGTIGMVRNKQNVLATVKGCLCEFIKKDPQTHDPLFASKHDWLRSDECALVLPHIENLKRVTYKICEYDRLLDSSNMGMKEWTIIARDIEKYYKDFDGFVVLHGTDTLAYTSSALSFMLENLGKPVILTGSQIPIVETVTDGKDNFVCSVAIAGNYPISEVCVFFNHNLYRGNRITKMSTNTFEAFQSHNYPALATVGTSFTVDYRFTLAAKSIAKFTVHPIVNENVSLLKIFPGIAANMIKSLMKPPVQGVVIQSFGAGNMPNNKEELVEQLKSAISQGIIIVNVTQCSAGTVSSSYESGKVFYDIGVLPGYDMTPEAAFTKLSYVLSRDDWDIETKKKQMTQSLRGELSHSSISSIKEIDLVSAVSNTLKLSSPEDQEHLKKMLFPSMSMDAVIKENLNKLNDLKGWGCDFNICNADGRTPLHIACRVGNVKIVAFLLTSGSNVHITDKFGSVPLLEAVRNDHKEIIKLMRISGAQLNMDPRDLGNILCRIAAQGLVNRLKSYSLSGADLNVTNMDERTPLHEACLHGQLLTVKYLMHKNVDQNKIDFLGYRAIDLAIKFEHKEIVAELRRL
ncbi:L-asparaginase 1 [Halyomorpha halys]|uniref:L-asparaginase 1 n=1 Tax=Halyomorpha halys TaxID=286706 RepID=UPI0006D4EDFE|nr:uncharacterized protein LOC106690375 [Halyomorpha halys]